MPATVDAVRVFLGLSPARPVDDDALTAAVAAANAVVVMLRTDVLSPIEPGDEWPAQLDYGAIIYAARLYGRRGSVQGVVAYQEMAVQMRATDPDVWLLLQLGEYQDSVIA